MAGGKKRKEKGDGEKKGKRVVGKSRERES